MGFVQVENMQVSIGRFLRSLLWEGNFFLQICWIDRKNSLELAS